MARLLDNWLASYMKLVEDTEPPPRYHLWTAVTIIGAMLGRKCEVRFGPETFFPNLYCVLIGPPGAARKGTALAYGTSILNEIQTACMAPDAVTKEQLIAEMELIRAEENINGNIFTHSSLFVVAPELVVFVKENDHERIGYLCTLYDGLPKFEYKTKTSGNSYVVNPGLWILGATTPNWIEISMRQLGVGGGITSRIIFVYADKKAKHIPLNEMKPFDPVLRSKLITDLATIRQMAGRFTVTKEAGEEYAKWYRGEYTETSIDDSRFASYWSRLPAMVAKVSMIVSAAKRENYVIEAGDIVMAIRMFRAIHPDMPRAFGGLGQNILGSQTEMVRDILRDKGKAYRHEILHTLRMHISHHDYERIRNTLIAERFCKRTQCQEVKDELLICLETQTEETKDGTAEKEAT